MSSLRRNLVGNVSTETRVVDKVSTVARLVDQVSRELMSTPNTFVNGAIEEPKDSHVSYT